MIEKTKKKVYKQNIFCQKEIYFFKQSLESLFLILLVNLLDQHYNGFDILISADRSAFLSLKIFNRSQSAEKSMTRRQLSNYALSSIRLNRYKSYSNIFKKFYSELATNLVQKIPIVPNNFNPSSASVALV